MPTSPLRLDRDQVRTVRLASQGLVNVPGTPATTIVARSGFVRTLGGCDAYLALRARQRTLHRGEVDTAVDRAELQVVPAARGCMYLVPRASVPLCLRFAEQMSKLRAAREQEKAGIRKGEIDDVAAAAVATLRQHGPLTTDALRKAMPDGTVRSLGEQGKKVGISSPLPGALRQLEFAGRVERTPEGARLDTERYLWRLPQKDPFAGSKVPEDPVQLHAQMLARFVEHAGVATLAEFCTWSGLSQRDAKAALPHAPHVPTLLDGGIEAIACARTEDLLRLGNAVRAVAAFLPFEDNLVHLYGGPGHLVDPQFHELAVPSWGREASVRLGTAPHLSLRGLIADGRLCGFWEYDPDAHLAVPHCFHLPSKAAQLQIEELSASVTTFLRDEIGHGHSFSLDTDDELRKRLGQLRALSRQDVVVAAKAAARRSTAPAPTRTGKAVAAKTGTPTVAPTVAKKERAASATAKPRRTNQPNAPRPRAKKKPRAAGKTPRPTKTVELPRTPPRRRP